MPRAGSGASISSRSLSEASARARRREHASAYLREVGLKSATVVIDNGSRKSIWRVPELDIDLDHRRSRSSIAGRAKIESLAGPWTAQLPHLRARERQDAAARRLRAGPGAARARTHPAAARRPRKPRRAGVGRGQARSVQHRRDPERHHRHRCRAGPGVCCHGSRRRRCASMAGIWRCPTAAPRAGSRSRPRCWCGATAACSSPAASRTPRRAPSGARLGLRPASRPAAGSAPSRRYLPQLTIDDWTARGFVAPERGRVVLSAVQLAGRRRRGLRRGRRDGHGRRHEGAPRRQDRADAGQHLQDALAGAARAAQPRLGGQASGARLAAGRLVPARHELGRQAGRAGRRRRRPRRAR